MRILPCGDEALLVEVANLREAEALYGRLRRDPPPGVIDMVPAARTVLIAFDPAATGPARLRALLHGMSAAPLDREQQSDGAPGLDTPRSDTPRSDTPGPDTPGHTAAASHAVVPGSDPRCPAGADPIGTKAKDSPATVTIPVRYDGPDLVDVARLTGLTPAQIVERHLRGRHRVAFCGFAPGFAYIAGLDPALRVPRRDSPRTRVPAGAVAIADEFSGVYPRASPGGWHLIGQTDLAVFDLTHDPPALLAPGTLVRFVAVGAARAVWA
ncbi:MULTISPECIES: 5-oxoprolinase subunit B family protein [Frankia]|uniref:Allophanate hydrolase n=1 Tax=Frankia alni (strain DSM 45986 / CECT 9034 / ACN14a) TaxID=326424 RepID=Q0RG41_FRAAA|nr:MULTISPECIES: allophanate hydrolase subunit 1 [Frankia]CAJ63548.1 putative allophanate hydrolase [Frankia alni ACN14a]